MSTDPVPGDPSRPLFVDRAVLNARTAGEFGLMLDKIRSAAGLTCGQIAAKTGIPRSQAYNLASAKRTTVPSNGEQVRQFVEACNLPRIQTDIVMAVWNRLQQQSKAHGLGRAMADREEQAALATSSRADALLSDVISAVQEPLAQRQHELSGTTFKIYVENRHAPSKRKAPVMSDKASWIDVVHFAVSDPGRTKRLLRLLTPVASVLVAYLALIAITLIKAPQLLIVVFSPLIIIALGLMVTRLVLSLFTLLGESSHSERETELSGNSEGDTRLKRGKRRGKRRHFPIPF